MRGVSKANIRRCRGGSFQVFLSPAAAFDAIFVAIEKILLMPLLLPGLARLHGQSEAPLSSPLSFSWAQAKRQRTAILVLFIFIAIVINILIIIIITVVIIIIGCRNLTNLPQASGFQSRGCNWPLFVNYSFSIIIITIIILSAPIGALFVTLPAFFTQSNNTITLTNTYK